MKEDWNKTHGFLNLVLLLRAPVELLNLASVEKYSEFDSAQIVTHNGSTDVLLVVKTYGL